MKEERIGAQVVCEAGVGGIWVQAETQRPGGSRGVKDPEVQDLFIFAICK